MWFFLGVLCEYMQWLRHHDHDRIDGYDSNEYYKHSTPLCRQTQQVVIVSVSDNYGSGIVC